jgi:hypothetical protein
MIIQCGEVCARFRFSIGPAYLLLLQLQRCVMCGPARLRASGLRVCVGGSARRSVHCCSRVSYTYYSLCAGRYLYYRLTPTPHRRPRPRPRPPRPSAAAPTAHAQRRGAGRRAAVAAGGGRHTAHAPHGGMGVPGPSSGPWPVARGRGGRGGVVAARPCRGPWAVARVAVGRAWPSGQWLSRGPPVGRDVLATRVHRVCWRGPGWRGAPSSHRHVAAAGCWRLAAWTRGVEGGGRRACACALVASWRSRSGSAWGAPLIIRFYIFLCVIIMYHYGTMAPHCASAHASGPAGGNTGAEVGDK